MAKIRCYIKKMYYNYLNKMSWADILKKNDNEFQTEFYKESIQHEIIYEENNDPYIKNIDDEFEYIYINKIMDIKDNFKEYIDSQAFPFLNKNSHSTLNFYIFIKNNCFNLLNLEKIVEKENKEYFEDIENEDIKEYEEYKEYYEYDK